MLDTEAEPTMRKRSRYRPKGVILNPMAYVMEGMVPVTQHGSYLVTLKIRNHGALANLTQGKATKRDVDELIECFNVAEALYRMGMGREYGSVLREAQQALLEVGARGLDTGRFLCTGPQIGMLNTMMELHDAQLDLCTVRDIDEAIRLVRRTYLSGNVVRIKGKPSVNNCPAKGDTDESEELTITATTTRDTG